MQGRCIYQGLRRRLQILGNLSNSVKAFSNTIASAKQSIGTVSYFILTYVVANQFRSVVLLSPITLCICFLFLSAVESNNHRAQWYTIIEFMILGVVLFAQIYVMQTWFKDYENEPDGEEWA
jgi:hypothetical protein